MEPAFYNDRSNPFSRKNIITFLILAIIAAAIPVGVRLIQEQQLLRGEAAVDQIRFTGSSIYKEGDDVITPDATVSAEITSPFPPPASAATFSASLIT